MAKVKEKGTLVQQAKAFAALPKKERKAQFSALPDNVKLLAREMVTMRNRGFRHVNGRIEFTQEKLASEIARLKQKRDDFEARKIKLDQKVKDYQDEYAERFGALSKELK